MSRACTSRHRIRGVTLIELLVSLMVIALAGVALAGTLGFIARNSGTTLAEAQARAIADAYLAEALAMPFADPAPPNNESNRAAFDDIGDYNGLNDANAADQSGTPMSGNFQVTVTVLPSAGLPLIPAANARRVDVTVSTVGGVRVVATGYRTNHP
jgi:MSHA pilin protein MshD